MNEEDAAQEHGKRYQQQRRAEDVEAVVEGGIQHPQRPLDVNLQKVRVAVRLGLTLYGCPDLSEVHLVQIKAQNIAKHAVRKSAKNYAGGAGFEFGGEKGE